MCDRHSSHQNTDKTVLQKDKQGTYNVTLWRVGLTFIAVEKQQYILCVFLRYMSLSTIYKYCVTQQ